VFEGSRPHAPATRTAAVLRRIFKVESGIVIFAVAHVCFVVELAVVLGVAIKNGTANLRGGVYPPRDIHARWRRRRRRRRSGGRTRCITRAAVGAVGAKRADRPGRPRAAVVTAAVADVVLTVFFNGAVVAAHRRRRRRRRRPRRRGRRGWRGRGRRGGGMALSTVGAIGAERAVRPHRPRAAVVALPIAEVVLAVFNGAVVAASSHPRGWG